MLTQGIKVFVGEGDSATLAADAAEASMNAWMRQHQWRQSDGQSSYTPALRIDRVHEGWWICALAVLGPLEETQPHDQAYTGVLQRLS